MRQFESFFGVDFSGAKQAGKNIWVARVERRTPRAPLRLLDLYCLGKTFNANDRDAAMECLVGLIAGSSRSVWAVDAPMSLPVELLGRLSWPALLRLVKAWDAGDYEFGVWCLNKAKSLGGPNHIYRRTDREMKTPFSCYHYRIIYQSFYAMRDVALPLSKRRGTAVLPFQYRRLPRAHRVLVEACPSSTLKRLGLPHHNYKQPEGGPLTGKRRRTRRTILDGLQRYVRIEPRMRRVMMRNPGGDAIDAVLAAVGVEQAWRSVDHDSIRHDRRLCREGLIYA